MMYEITDVYSYLSDYIWLMMCICDSIQFYSTENGIHQDYQSMV